MLLLNRKPTPVGRIDFSPDGQTLALNSGANAIELWDVHSPDQPRKTLLATQFDVFQTFRFSPFDGSLVALLGREVVAFDPDTLGERWRFNPQPGALVGGMDVGARGELYLSFSHGPLKREGYQCWRWAMGQAPTKLWAVPGPNAGHTVASIFTTGRVVFGNLPKPFQQAQLFHFSPLETLAHTLHLGPKPPSILTASPDGTLLAANCPHALLVWRLAMIEKSPAVIRPITHSTFTSLAFHPSGRYLAATSNDATVKLYDTSNWALATTYTWDVGRMRSVAFSPDGLLAAAGSDTGRVVVWDVDV